METHHPYFYKVYGCFMSAGCVNKILFAHIKHHKVIICQISCLQLVPLSPNGQKNLCMHVSAIHILSILLMKASTEIYVWIRLEDQAAYCISLRLYNSQTVNSHFPLGRPPDSHRLILTEVVASSYIFTSANPQRRVWKSTGINSCLQAFHMCLCVCVCLWVITNVYVCGSQ